MSAASDRASPRLVRADAAIYVNSDASYKDGCAGIAYESAELGNRCQLATCRNSTEAELLALLLAMDAAEKAQLTSVVFRTDCKATAHPHWRAGPGRLRQLKQRVARHLAIHADWRLEKVHRSANVVADGLARNALRTRPKLRIDESGHGA
jgi:ribonuclease HI